MPCHPAGYVANPPTVPEERGLLVQLFGLTLGGRPAVHARLADALLALAAMESACRDAGTVASLGEGQPRLRDLVAEAICGLKAQVIGAVATCGSRQGGEATAR